MKYLWLCLSIAMLGCSNPSPLSTHLQRSVDDITNDNDSVFSSAYTDLNDDGLEDALVLLQGIQWCGSGGCTLLIFKNLGQSYQLVTKTTVTNTPISVANTESNGWKDIIVWSRGSGFVLLSFNGDTYPRNPSLQPPVSESQLLAARTVLQ
jgi:hypothetical protein